LNGLESAFEEVQCKAQRQEITGYVKELQRSNVPPQMYWQGRSAINLTGDLFIGKFVQYKYNVICSKKRSTAVFRIMQI